MSYPDEKAIDELSRRILAKSHLLTPKEHQPTITSGFNLEVLRLSEKDVKFLTDCGVKVE